MSVHHRGSFFFYSVLQLSRSLAATPHHISAQSCSVCVCVGPSFPCCLDAGGCVRVVMTAQRGLFYLAMLLHPRPFAAMSVALLLHWAYHHHQVRRYVSVLSLSSGQTVSVGCHTLACTQGLGALVVVLWPGFVSGCRTPHSTRYHRPLVCACCCKLMLQPSTLCAPGSRLLVSPPAYLCTLFTRLWALPAFLLGHMCSLAGFCAPHTHSALIYS